MRLLDLLGWRGGLRAALDDLNVDRTDLQRLLLLVLVCALSALVVVDYTRAPTDTLSAGDVAPRTVKAPYSFKYQDFAERERRQRDARDAVPPVFVHRPDLDDELRGRISEAFAEARGVVDVAPSPDGTPAVAPDPRSVYDAFRGRLGVHVPDHDLAPLYAAGFPPEAEALSGDLLARAMRGYIVGDRTHLPGDRKAVRVIEVQEQAREELTFTDLGDVTTPPDARQQVTLGVLESNRSDRWVDAAATVARAMVRPNFVYDHLETEDRRARAAAEVPMAPVTVKRGTTLFRQGDVLTDLHLLQYRALQSSRSEHGVFVEIVAVGLFLFLLLVSLYHFAATYLQDFSTELRDAGAVGVLLVFTAASARLAVGSSEMLTDLVGAFAPTAIWFAVPVAGAAMLVRLLVGVAWTVVFSFAAAAICGLVMDLQALYVVFFVISSIAAAGAVEHTRERMAVLRAGLFTGVVNATAVLLIHFLMLFVSDGSAPSDSALQPLWSMGFGLVGGLLSGAVVLGLVPLFESAGFVTDYRLMELANLNHPLLRQLMLRAPGSYHHSVIVGSLAEAACEAVGANALQARVASYFHDIGKSLKPQYFIENQRGANRHDKIDPYSSAQIIIGHVVEGARMAREYRLPKPIVDNIHMHHGTGLLAYFYSQARAQADDPSQVDPAAFRYPGPKPATREAGIVMLADKVEAATRTIKEPNEESIRAMIHKIINSVMADGQFEKCPLTFQEIHTIADTFVKVLLGIYHHRIEYPATADISRTGQRVPPVKSEAVITLEIPSTDRPEGTTPAPPPGRRPAEGDENVDWESIEHLPRGK